VERKKGKPAKRDKRYVGEAGLKRCPGGAPIARLRETKPTAKGVCERKGGGKGETFQLPMKRQTADMGKEEN